MTECSFQLHQPYSRSWVIVNPSNWLIESCSCHCFRRPKHQSSENLLIIKGWENRQSPVKDVLSVKTSGWNSVSGRQLHTLCTPLFTSHSVRHRWSAEHNFRMISPLCSSAGNLLFTHILILPWAGAFPSFMFPSPVSGPAISCTAADRAVVRAGPSVSASVK